ncbi:hypothetical protein EVB27_058 [Rhizobium phage RHph_TM16]|nr:hypothetical protein EVB27_058 [Rhizobium phage RHph_TM16]
MPMTEQSKKDFAALLRGDPTPGELEALKFGHDSYNRPWYQTIAAFRANRAEQHAQNLKEAQIDGKPITYPPNPETPPQSAPEPSTEGQKLREWDDIATSLENSISRLSNMMVDQSTSSTYEDELRKIATMVGEPNDPFAAWETIANVYGMLKEAEELLESSGWTGLAERIRGVLDVYEDPL